MKKNQVLFSLFLSGIALLLAGCGNAGEPSTSGEPPAAQVSEEQLAPLETPAVDEGLLAYLSGIVDISEGNEWIPAEIGDRVTRANSVKTGPDSSCEIQFASTAVIRLQENTEIEMRRVSLTPEASKVGLKMVAGSVLAKVQKLSNQDSFSVTTQSAVCGVRGTEFSVSVGDGTETVLAVKEGSVAVLPPSMDVESLKEQVADKGSDATEALEVLLAAAPKVGANEELTLDDAYVRETREAADRLTEAVDKIVAAESEEEVRTTTGSLAAVAGASSAVLAGRSEPVRTISPEKTELLKQTDKMKILTLPVAAGRESAASVPEVRLHKIALKVDPRDARIRIDGDPAATGGTGNFSALYEEGRTLTIGIERAGFAPYSLPVLVTSDSAKLYSIKLAALQTDTPVPAAIPEPEQQGTPSPDEQPVPEASVKPAPESALEVAPEATAAAAAKTGQAVAGEPTPPRDEAPQPVTVTLTVRPADAAILINGSRAGEGRATTDALPGTSLEILVRRRGFSPAELTLEVGERPTERSIVLNARPIVVRRKLLQDSVIGLAATDRVLVAADAKGRLAALGPDGRALWSLESGNTPNENSTPVIIGNRVYFSGAKELVIANARSGNSVTRVNLDSNHSHLFGRRVVPFGEAVLFPANDAIEFLNPADGSFRQFVPLDDPGSRMTPAVNGGRVMIVNQEGIFALFGADGTPVGQVSTRAVQPVALAASVLGDNAVFAGRRGDVAVIDLSDISVRWERAVSEVNISVVSDLEIGTEGIYLFSRDGTIYGLNRKNGAELFTPIRGASTPPVYRNGELIYGTRDGKLIIASASSGATRKSLELDGTTTTRPVFIDGMIGVGTKTGEVMMIEPAGIR